MLVMMRTSVGIVAVTKMNKGVIKDLFWGLRRRWGVGIKEGLSI